MHGSEVSLQRMVDRAWLPNYDSSLYGQGTGEGCCMHAGLYIYIGNGEMGENKTQDPINSHPWMHDINVIVIGVLNALTNCKIIIIIIIKQQ